MRAIASLSLTFGLVSIPVKVYSATESQAAIRFKLMGRGGARVRRRYTFDEADAAPEVEPTPAPEPPAPRGRAAAAEAGAGGRRLTLVEPPAAAPEQDDAEDAWQPPPSRAQPAEPADLVKGYEFERGKFVLFTPAELKALQGASRQTIDIVAFIPNGAVDPVYYDKAYYLAPDKRGERTYSLLLAAMRKSGRSALAKWAWRSKEYVVEVRAGDGGLVLQQLYYADEVRPLAALAIPLVDVGDTEMQLALQLIEQVSEPAYDPTRYVDEEKQRILAAVEQKIAGREVVAPAAPAEGPSGQVIDLIEALRASLKSNAKPAAPPPEAARKPARRAAKAAAAPEPRSVKPRRAR